MPCGQHAAQLISELAGAMVQTRMTRFLSESQTDIQDGGNSTDDSGVTDGQASHNKLPTSKKGKKQIRMAKKQARKRDKLLRRGGKKGTPVSKSDNSACIGDVNDNILLTERSLTDKLASDTPQPILSSSPHSVNNCSQNDNILQESRMLALSLQLEGQTNEDEKLKNVVDLLESEITEG